jgi:hypothetical protein
VAGADTAPADLVLRARVIGRRGETADGPRGATIEIMAEVLAPDGRCPWSLPIVGLPAAPASQLAPSTVLATAARQIVRAAKDGDRVLIDRAAGAGDRRGAYLEKLLRHEIVSAASRNDGAGAFRKLLLETHLAREGPAAPPGGALWRARIELHPVSGSASGALDLSVIAAKEGAPTISVRQRIALAELPAERPPPLNVAFAPAHVVVGEEVRIRITTERRLHVYCLLHDEQKHESYVILPVPSADRAPLDPRAEPHEITGLTVAGSVDAFKMRDTGESRIECWGLNVPLPAAAHGAWMADQIRERRSRNFDLKIEPDAVARHRANLDRAAGEPASAMLRVFAR